MKAVSGILSSAAGSQPTSCPTHFSTGTGAEQAERVVALTPCDPIYGRSLQHSIHNIHACDHLGEYRVVVIEPGIVHEVDEYLSITGVPASGRYSYGTAEVRTHC